jgi:hypothetical protein
MKNLTTNKLLNDQLGAIYNHATNLSIKGPIVINEDAFERHRQAYAKSDCCNEDYYTEGFHTICACCGYPCELVTP